MRRFTRVVLVGCSIAVVLSGDWPIAAKAQAQEIQEEDCPDPETRRDQDPDGEDDCPNGSGSAGGRSHRRGDDGSDTTFEHDTGGGSFRSGSRFPRGNGESGTPAGSVGTEGSGGASTGGTAGGAAGAIPGPPTGGAPSTPGPVAVSSPGPPAAAPPSGRAESGSLGGAPEVAGAGQSTRSMPRTGRDIGIPVGLAMTLLVAGTSLRRAARPRPPRRRPRRGDRRPRARPMQPTLPSWSYVDHSAAGRAIEKF